MTSKEIEERSGVAKANIRYYEAEGLLTPGRGKNGYRDYGEDDLILLEKIKLLRRLGVPVAELRELIGGRLELSAVLDRRLEELGRERAVLSRVERVCGALRAESPAFDRLDAPRYLSALDAPAEAEDVPPPEPEGDVLPAVTSAGRRYFARLFDWFLLIWISLAALTLGGMSLSRVNITHLSIFLVAVTLFLEPLLLWRFGATPGKALLGLRLSGPEGGRMSYRDWFTRHLMMLWYGKGAGIPVWQVIQCYRSWRRCRDGEPQPWDAGFAYTAEPWRPRMALTMVLAALAVTAAAEAANSYSQLPPNRGELTVAEFAENYNRQLRYYGLSDSEYLDGDGVRRERSWVSTGAVVHFSDGWDRGRDLRYTVEDGVLTAVTFTQSAENTEYLVSMPTEELFRLVLSYVWAAEETPFWSWSRISDLGEDWEHGFTTRLYGTVIAVDVDQSGFLIAPGGSVAYPDGNQPENHLACTVTVALDRD